MKRYLLALLLTGLLLTGAALSLAGSAFAEANLSDNLNENESGTNQETSTVTTEGFSVTVNEFVWEDTTLFVTVSVTADADNQDNVELLDLVVAEDFTGDFEMFTEFPISLEPGETADLLFDLIFDELDADETPELPLVELEYRLSPQGEVFTLAIPLTWPVDNEENVANEDGSSDVSRAVHQALTGRDDLRPGDDGFGAAVSERARQGNLGAAVSEAARSQNPGRGGENGRGRPSGN